MKPLRILSLLMLLFAKPAFSQITCDPSGNVVLYSNYDGGILNINVDVNIPNLKIGVVSYEMVTINLSGPFVNNITEIQFAGYTTTTHHHCSNSPAVTSIVGAPAGTDTLVFMPNSPVANANGYNIIICNYSCDTSTNQGGCNTPDQIAAYFQQEFGGLLRYHFTQYGCWAGSYNISDGGNCCVSTVSPSPVALFSSDNHICPGSCTDFINLSANATSYQWYFPGANPDTSTAENPANICYNMPGNYDVTLIATGPGGVDTIQLNNYMTVYPYPPPLGIQQFDDTLVADSGFVAYQWYYNGTLIPGATNNYCIASQAGDYDIIATDINGCEVEAISIGILIGIPENHAAGIVFKNPVGAMIEIQPASDQIHSVKIFDVTGKVILNNSGLTGNSIQCDWLQPGIYFLELTVSGKTYRSHFVKN